MAKAPKNPSANKTSAAPAKMVPFQHPPAAFPMDAMHAGNAPKKGGKSSKMAC
jgi:hypothetical protein